MKNFILFIILLETSIGFTQEQGTYSPFYRDIYLNSDSTGVYHSTYKSYKICDSASMGYRSVTKYYKTGELAMSFLILKYQIIRNSDYNQYILSGIVKTFYPTGRVRSKYVIDSMGLISDPLCLYNERGKLVQKVEFKENLVFNGLEVSPSAEELNETYLSIYENGVLVDMRILKDEKLYFLDEQDVLIRENKRSFRKYFKNYNLLNPFIQYSPPNY